MRKLVQFLPELRPTLVILLPIGLWMMLWLSINPADPAALLKPGSTTAFIHAMRGLLPFFAAAAAVATIGVGVLQRNRPGFGLFGPLSLTVVYGLVGIVAAFKSPNGSVALWWAALYLSVPIVLWAVWWSANPLDQVRRLINVTWLIVILAAAASLATAVIYLDLFDKLLHPAQLLQCDDARWFDLTSGQLRATGVGRYVSIAALVAISGLWQRKWRPVWIVVLLSSVTMLLYSGARGSFAGFAAGASLMLLIYLVCSGKRAVLTGLLIIAVLAPIMWATGAPNTFLERCVFRSTAVPAVLASVPPETVAETTNATLAASLGGSDQEPAQRIGNDAATNEQPAQVKAPNADSSPATLAPTTTPAGPAMGEQPADVKELEGASSPETTAPVATPEGPVAGEQPADVREPDTDSSTASLVSVAAPVDSPLNAVEQPTSVGSAEKPATLEQPADSVEPEAEAQNELISDEFFEFSGRAAVWAEAWGLFKDSPLIGFGFHADRLMLGTHMHNSFMQALLQTGLFGTVPFVLAMILAWGLFVRILRKLVQLSFADKHMVIQSGGVLAFLTMRSFPESTGAFFGVDWLILAVVLFYLQGVNYWRQPLSEEAADSNTGRG